MIFDLYRHPKLVYLSSTDILNSMTNLSLIAHRGDKINLNLFGVYLNTFKSRQTFCYFYYETNTYKT